MMSFKTFIWPNDPKNLNINMIKNSKIYYLPSLGPVRKQIGYDYRIIKGFGEFFGPKCVKHFNQLSKIFSESSPGQLLMPPMEPMKVFFSELSMNKSSKPNIISYNFKFIEDLSNFDQPYIFNDKKFYQLKPNENLWNIANKFNIKIDDILKLNPSISNPYDVTPDMKVIIP